MNNLPDAAPYLLAVYAAVSLLKSPRLSPWAVRIMAILLGGLFTLANFQGGVDFHGQTWYEVLIVGLQAGFGAILTYHIGNGDFISIFDRGDQPMDPTNSTDASYHITHLTNEVTNSTAQIAALQEQLRVTRETNGKLATILARTPNPMFSEPAQDTDEASATVQTNIAAGPGTLSNSDVGSPAVADPVAQSPDPSGGV